MSKDTWKLRGFAELEIVDPDGSVVGKAKVENSILDNGFANYLARSLAGAAGSTPSVGFIGLGSAAATSAVYPSTKDILDNPISTRQAVTTATSSQSARFTGTFASNVLGVSYSINQIGLFASSGSTAGTGLAAACFADSSVETNQAVNCTYTIGLAQG